MADRGKDGGFYVEGVAPDEIAAMAAASVMEGVDQEIVLLRVLIRFVTREGDVDQVRRCMETLAHLVTLKHKVSEGERSSLERGLGRVLDVLGEELGEKL